MELDPQIVIGKYEFTWFHLVILAVLVVLLGFGIVALKRDSSEEQQEIYRQEREEAIRLRQEVMAERKQEMQDAYNAMKRRRAERLAAQGMAPTAAQAMWWMPWKWWRPWRPRPPKRWRWRSKPMAKKRRKPLDIARPKGLQ